jgi:hypothetical protein
MLPHRLSQSLLPTSAALDRAEKKAWFRFLDQATDEELSRAASSLTAEVESATDPDDLYDNRWRLRTLREEQAACAELARVRKRYSAR